MMGNYAKVGRTGGQARPSNAELGEARAITFLQPPPGEAVKVKVL